MSYNPYAYAADDSNGMNVNDRYSRSQQPQTHAQFPAYSQQQQQQQQQQYSQPQQSQQGFSFQNPGATMAYQLGQSAFSNFIGQDSLNQIQENLTKATKSSANVSHYFQVSNSYVFHKLKVILFPFLHRNWQRIPDAGSNGAVSFQPPKTDINSPDMYIPIMGLVTYILVWNVQQGLHGSFHPEHLYYKLSSTLAFVALDMAILKLGLYLLVPSTSPTTSLMELLCYVGYKFVPLTFVPLLPSAPYMLSELGKIALFIAFGVFLLRSVKFNLFVDGSSDVHTVKKSVVKKCNYFLFVYGFVWQGVLMWLMG